MPRISALLLSFALLQAPVFAEKYALLVGIGNYGTGFRRLHGPENDVASLVNLLIERSGFKPANVRTIVNGHATRGSILGELDTALAKLSRGDFFFLYFSGHGTGPEDPSSADLKSAGLQPFTGALLPAEIRPGPVDEVMNTLIIGRRDLTPRLARIDGIARVFAVFDTCFSSDSIKAVDPPYGQNKGVPLSLLIRSDAREDEKIVAKGMHPPAHAEAEEPPYPYKTVAYLSAAGRHETATDIWSPGREPLPTYDGKAHGALTNYLIVGLQGAADANADGIVSIDELYRYVRFWAVRRYQQSPQLLGAESRTTEAAMGPGTPPVKNGPEPVPSTVLIKVTGDPVLSADIKALPRVVVADHDFDLRVDTTADGNYVVTTRSGAVQTFGHFEKKLLLERIAAEAFVGDIVESRFPDQRFSVVVRTSGGPKPVYTTGETIAFQAKSDKAGVGTFLNIDAEGTVTVLAADVRIPAGKWVDIGPPVRVESTAGPEYVKLVVDCSGKLRFNLPANATARPGEPVYQQIVKLVSDPDACHAQATELLITRTRW